MPGSAEHDVSAVFAARLAGGLIGPPGTSLVIAEWAGSASVKSRCSRAGP
jgi:hypothetical protein